MDAHPAVGRGWDVVTHQCSRDRVHAKPASFELRAPLAGPSAFPSRRIEHLYYITPMPRADA
jgi:hypothetical protein